MFLKFIKKILKILGFFLILSLAYGEEIKVVMDDSFPPYSFRDKKGKMQGIAVDKWREFEKVSGIRVILQGVAFSEAQAKVRSGEADIIDMFFYSKAREQFYSYSKQKEDIEVALFYNKEIVSIGSIEEMKSYDIAVRQGEITVDFLTENGVKNMVQYSSYDEIIEAAKHKRIKVFCMNSEAAKFLISKNKMEQEFIHGMNLFKGKMHFAVYGNKNELLKNCDYWFGKISNSEKERIINKWKGKELLNKIDYFKLALIILTAVAIIAILLLFIYNLNKKLLKKKLENELMMHKLEIEKNKVEAILNTIPDMVTIINEQLIIEDINVGKNSESIKLFNNKKFAHISSLTLPKHIKDEAAEGIKKAILKHESVVQVYSLEIDGKSRFFESRILPYENSKAIAITRDITEKVEKEEELERAKEAAEKANKAKSQFLANMSHEIRTPMNGVIGAIELFKDSELNEEQKNFLNIMEDSAERLAKLINNVLDISKIEAGKVELNKSEFNIEECVEKIVEGFGVTVNKKGIELVYSIEEGIPELVIGDSVKIGQVLTNLIGNAIKFTEKGNVFLDVTKISEDKEQVMLNFCISDTGIGILAESMSTLFQPFVQVDMSYTKQYQGTGLGLSISKMLVKMMGGEIGATSEAGKGSKFNFTLSLTKSKIQGEEKNRIPEKTKIMVVDNNLLNRFILRRVLQEAGADVIEAENAIEAEKAAKASEKIDILIIDAGSLKENSLEAETGLIKISQIKKVIAMLGSAELKERIEEIKKAGISDYIIKPVIKSKLLKKIMDIVSIKQEIQKEEFYKKEENSTALLDILIAEDNKVNRETIKAMCEKSNQTQIRTAENGKICIEEVTLKRPDLILMDIQMPEINGVEATEIIRKMAGCGSIPIVGVTAYAFASDIQNFMEKGMNEIITKPVKIGELRRILEKYSKKGQ